MKKLIFILISLFLLSGCATIVDTPFSPGNKYGKHKTKKCKPVKGVIKNCKF